MDIDKAGLYIGLIALVLAIPLSIIANLITPKIRDRYSTTSQQRLRKRIAELEMKLATSSETWAFTEAEWMLLVFVYRSASLITTCIFFIALFLLTQINPIPRYPTLLSKASVEIISVLRWIGIFLPMIGITWLNMSFTSMKEAHTEKGREMLRKQIENLKRVEVRQASSVQ